MMIFEVLVWVAGIAVTVVSLMVGVAIYAICVSLPGLDD
jgi:hypothetical protein